MPSSPRHQFVRRMGKQPRPFDQLIGACRGIEMAEHIGPGAVAAHRRGEPAIAIGKAAHPPHRNAGAGGGVQGCLGKHRSRHGHKVKGEPAAAGDANEDRDRRLGRGAFRPLVVNCDFECHPQVSRAIAPCGARAVSNRISVQDREPQVTTIARAPARRADRRQVSWLAGRCPSPPSRVIQWLGMGSPLQLRGSCGMGTRLRRFCTAFLFALSIERPSITAS